MQRSLTGNLVPLDLEIEATLRRNKAERRRKLLQDRTVASILEEEAQSSNSTSSDSLSSRESTIYLPEASVMADEHQQRVTLEDYSREAMTWLHSFKGNSLKTWEEVFEKFMKKYFPESKTIERKAAISSFHQFPDESLSEALERFRGLLRKTPTHEFSGPIQLNMFIDGLRPQTKQLLDASVGGKIKLKTPEEETKLIENMSASDHAILHDRVYQPTKKSLLELSSQDPVLAQNKLQVIPFVVVLMNPTIVFLLKNKRGKLVTWEINRDKDTIKEDFQDSSKVGQLAKLLAEKSSNSFGANTEKNPKEECKAVVTRCRKLVAAEDEDVVAFKDTTVKKKNEMTSRKRKSTASRPQAQYDTRRFQSLEAWNGYTDNILDRRILPKRNVKIYHTEFDEFKANLEMCNLHKSLANLQEGSIDVAVEAKLQELF
ncbi:hypothetical protein HKD37_12G034382 [Glycine soja]